MWPTKTVVVAEIKFKKKYVKPANCHPKIFKIFFARLPGGSSRQSAKNHSTEPAYNVNLITN